MTLYEIPFQLVTLEYDANVMPIVEAWLDDRAIRMVLDTGASHTCVDRDLVKPLLREKNVREEDSNAVMGLGGRRLSHTICRLPLLRIGDIEWHDYKVVAVRMRNINKMLAWLGLPAIGGLLGCDLLQTSHAVLDFDRLCLCLRKEETEMNAVTDN